MKTTVKVNIKIIFPDKNIYDKTYKVSGKGDPLKFGRRYAHYIIRKVFKKIYPNASHSDFLEYCGDCTVYVRKVL